MNYIFSVGLNILWTSSCSRIMKYNRIHLGFFLKSSSYNFALIFCSYLLFVALNNPLTAIDVFGKGVTTPILMEGFTLLLSKVDVFLQILCLI